jgi:hypothetical protein
MNVLPLIPAHARAQPGTLASARIDAVDDEGLVHVTLGDGPTLPARIAASPDLPLSALVVGADVLVLVEPGREEHPIIVSTILSRLPRVPAVLELAAEQQVVLRCGDASISIDANGHIELRGERIDSEAEGIQRIKGAQVRIN